MKLSFLLFLSFAVGSIVVATGLEPAGDDDNVSFRKHVELGNVHWHRDLERGKTVANSTGKPIFLLFQEVPG